MAYKNKADRDYAREYKTYQGTEEQKKNRAERNAARREMVAAGKVHKGDNKDVDHRTPLSKGGKNIKSNYRVETEHDNRSFDRNKDHSLKSNKPFKKKK